jgi:hypothetical protein
VSGIIRRMYGVVSDEDPPYPEKEVDVMDEKKNI